MSNNYWDEDEDDQDTPEQQLTGDDLVKKLRKAKRADEKRIKELTDQLETAAFSGAAGLGRTSLGRTTGGQI